MALIDSPEGGKESGIGESKVVKMSDSCKITNRQKTWPSTIAIMTSTNFQTLR